MYSLVSLVLPLVVLYLLYKYVTKDFGYWKKRNVFYVEPLPLIGNLKDVVLFKTSIGHFLGNMYNKTKAPVIGMYLFHKPCLLLKDPEVIKSVLIKDFKHFEDRTVYSPRHDPMTGHMLFFDKGSEWKLMRQKMTPIFSSGKIKAMIPLMQECGKHMNQYVERKGQIGTLEAKEICAKYTTNVIARCAFALDVRCFEVEDTPFRKAGRMVFDFTWSNGIKQASYFFFPILVDIFKFNFIDTWVSNFFRDVFWETVKHKESSGGKGDDVIDTLMRIKKDNDRTKEIPNFEGDKVLAQATQFFLAGFETTSSTIAFTLYELCIHPEIQNRVRDEVLTSLRANGSFTYDAIQKMKYLDMCLSETLRKYPSIPFLDRMCVKDLTVPGSDITIEKGTPCYISSFGLHYDEEHFPDPHTYNPERFSEDNASKVKPFTYLPFGDGPRNCIGGRLGLMSAKMGLCYILSEFELERTEETPVPIEYATRSIVLASTVGLPMRFKKIQVAA